MEIEAYPAELIQNATVRRDGRISNTETILSFREGNDVGEQTEYLWLDWERRFERPYGHYCEARNATVDNNVDNHNPVTFDAGDVRYYVNMIPARIHINDYNDFQNEIHNEVVISNEIRLSLQPPAHDDNHIILPCYVLSNWEQMNVDDKYHFVIKQFSNAENLSNHVININEIQIRDFFRQMVLAVHCLHNLDNNVRVFHQDLKLESFVLHNNEVFLSDFGRANIIGNAEELINDGQLYYGQVSQRQSPFTH